MVKRRVTGGRTVSRYIKILIVSILITNCGADNQFKNLKNANDRIKISDTLLINKVHPLGSVAILDQLDELNFIFLDFSHQGIFKYTLNPLSLTQLSENGYGPGEYRVPIYLQIINDKSIAFTDASSMDITVLSSNGELIKTIRHKHGGGRKFIYDQGKYYLQGSFDKLLNVINQDGTTLGSYIQLKRGYKDKAKNFGGGGIIQTDKNVYVMNSLEPTIYRFNKETKDVKEIVPEVWNVLEKNKDGYSIQNTPLQEIYNNKENYAIFMDLYKINIDNKLHIGVYTSYKREWFLFILDRYGNFKFIYNTENKIIGIKENKIFEIDDSNPMDPQVYIKEINGIKNINKEIALTLIGDGKVIFNNSKISISALYSHLNALNLDESVIAKLEVEDDVSMEDVSNVERILRLVSLNKMKINK